MGLTHHNAAVSFACVQTSQLTQFSINTSVTCAAAEPYEHHRAAYHHSEMAFGSFDTDEDDFDGTTYAVRYDTQHDDLSVTVVMLRSEQHCTVSTCFQVLSEALVFCPDCQSQQSTEMQTTCFCQEQPLCI